MWCEWFLAHEQTFEQMHEQTLEQTFEHYRTNACTKDSLRQ